MSRVSLRLPEETTNPLEAALCSAVHPSVSACVTLAPAFLTKYSTISACPISLAFNRAVYHNQRPVYTRRPITSPILSAISLCPCWQYRLTHSKSPRRAATRISFGAWGWGEVTTFSGDWGGITLVDSWSSFGGIMNCFGSGWKGRYGWGADESSVTGGMNFGSSFAVWELALSRETPGEDAILLNKKRTKQKKSSQANPGPKRDDEGWLIDRIPDGWSL